MHFIRFIPATILFLLSCYSWTVIFTNDQNITYTYKNLIATALTLASLASMYYRPKTGIVLTLLTILLWMFGLVHLSYYHSTVRYFIKISTVEISTPEVEWRAFVLLLVSVALFWPEIRQLTRAIIQRLDPPQPNSYFCFKNQISRPLKKTICTDGWLI